MSSFLPLFSLLFALGGVLVTLVVARAQWHHIMLRSPLRTSCNDLLSSHFSTFFGIPVGLLGFLCYFFLALLSAWGFFFHPTTPIFHLLLLFFTFGAFLFIFYLALVQLFSLEERCLWTIGMFFVSGAHLTVAFFLPPSLRHLLEPVINNILGVHIFSIFLGAGSIFSFNWIFIRSFTHFKLSPVNRKRLFNLSDVILFSLGGVVISGTLLSLFFYNNADHATLFMKILVTLIMLLTCSVFFMLIFPELMKHPFYSQSRQIQHELRYLRRLSHAFLSIIIVSWFLLIGLGMLHSFSFSFTSLLVTYLILIGISVLLSQLIERLTSHKTLY